MEPDKNNLPPPTGESTIVSPATPEAQWKTNKAEAPKEIYFFERHDGSVIEVDESEAWTLLSKGGNQKVIGRYTPPWKLIGVGSGEIFYRAVQEAHQKNNQGYSKEQVAQIIRKGRDDELAAARGHIKRPRNFDIMDNRRQPTDILSNSAKINL